MWIPEDPRDAYLDRGDAPMRSHRPLLQGDVLIDVPLALIKRFKEDPEYVGTESEVFVAMLGHPCASYAGGELVQQQTIAQVRELGGASGSAPFVAPWDSHWHLFPLPDLLGDGRDFVVDFRRIGTTHASNLRDKRIACLSHEGLTGFQRRYAKHSIRADLDESEWHRVVTQYWNEFELWEQWNGRDLPPPEFQAWLDDVFPSGPYQGVIRRDVLEYAPDVISEEIESI